MKKNRVVSITFLLIALMIIGTFVIPGLIHSDEDITAFGETLPNGTLYPYDGNGTVDGYNESFGDIDNWTDKPFTTSSDGDPSPESITQFSETVGDNVLIFPDSFYNDTINLASSGTSETTPTNDYTETHVKDGTLYSVRHDGFDTWITVNFTLQLASDFRIDGFYYNLYGRIVGGLDSCIKLYDWVSDTWQYAQSIGVSAWYNSTLHSNSDYWNGSNEISIRVFSDADAVNIAEIDYCEVVAYQMADFGYAESFVGVSDWAIQVGNTITSDDDVGSFHIDGDNVWDYYYTNAPSIANMKGRFIEFSFSANISGSLFRVYGFALDDHAGTSYALDGVANLFPTTSYQTKRFYIPHDVALESIRFQIKAPSSDTEVRFDYIRINPPDECGWQHDGSTTEGITDDGQANVTYSYSSDGDILTINGTRTAAGADYMDVWFEYDTTSTVADIELDYYQVLTFSVDSFSTVGCDITWGFIGDGKLLSSQVLSTGINRANIAASTGSNSAKRILWFSVSGVDNGDTFEIVLDWCKAVSIANYTYSASGVGTDDYLYVDSGVLCSHVDSGTIELNYDPALSVSDTYPVYNLTTSSTAPEFSMYVSEWSTYSDDTRGVTTSGTVTDIKLRFDGTENISAITFIEDGTAPVVVRSNANPEHPDDSEAVTLSAVITDALEVWTVKYNAIVYPSGFSDVDYSATEQSDNLWTYTFSAGTLNEGYYCFLISASDGANTNAATEYAYIDFTVGEVAITQFNLTLWQVNILDYHINIDWATAWGNSTLQAYDNDSLQATGTDEDATLQFAKSTAVGVHVLDFKITSGGSTIWKNNTKYEIAAAASLSIDIEFWTPLTATIRLIGSSNNEFNYYVYREGVYNSETGTTGSEEGYSFTVSRNTNPGSHDYQVYFNSSSLSGSRWFNFTDSVSEVYAWQYIEVADQGGNNLQYDIDLDIYINGSLIQGWKFYNRTDRAYNITIVDRFGDTLSSQVYSVPDDREYDITINVYSFKVKCWVDGEPVHVFVNSSGGGQQDTWLGWGDSYEWWVYGSNTYQIKWFLDATHKKVQADGWHYYPAVDADGNQLTPDPNWYTPIAASMITLDAYGIAHIFDGMPASSGGGGDSDANETVIAGEVFDALSPAIALGTGSTIGILGIALTYVLVLVRKVNNKLVDSNKPKRHPPSKPSGTTELRYIGKKYEQRTTPRKIESKFK